MSDQGNGYNAVLAGIGGQGILLASKILVQEAMQRGSSVLGAETHGMAQRGGSVIAHVRTGSCRSPMVLPRSAHLLVGLEKLEGLRNLAFLRPGGLLIANSADETFITPKVREYLQGLGARVTTLDATGLAIKGGSVRNANVVLLGGCAAADTPFELEAL